MLEDYKAALRAGQRAYRMCIARGQSPYLAVLDDILVNTNIVSQESLGLVNIPMDSIIGTKTSGRHTAFAPNFMPLLGLDTEFAHKWANLCDAHLSEGIHTPIQAYEFLNRFYVAEGNKRVSVLKHYGAVTIPGMVTRLIPAHTDSPENRLYYEFLDFYKLSHVNDVFFSRPGSFAKLQTAVCKASGESWTDDDRLKFSAFYTMFRQQFKALGGAQLRLTAGDAMLVYLSVYRYATACDSTPAQIKANLSKLWDEITVLTQPNAVELSLEPKDAPSDSPLRSTLNLLIPRPGELNVVFLHEHSPETSAWVKAHDSARRVLERTFPERLHIEHYENVDPVVDAEQQLEEVVHDGADVVFTSSVRMMTACLKVAAQHPKVKILNCSLNTPHPKVRTYYPRTFEATYLLGMLAGILSPGSLIGYVAAYPIYGVPAAINAFAQGARAVRPDVRILLRWSCQDDPAHPLDFSDRPDVTVFYAHDTREAADVHRDYGLCRRTAAGALEPLALPVWRWDVIYTAIVRSILNGTWDSAPSSRAINYWWGMRSGSVQIAYGDGLPVGTLQLLDLMEKQLRDGALNIFPTQVYSQGHTVHSLARPSYTPDELMLMDWLDECVMGALPHYETLDVKARRLADTHGLDIIKQ